VRALMASAAVDMGTVTGPAGAAGLEVAPDGAAAPLPEPEAATGEIEPIAMPTDALNSTEATAAERSARRNGRFTGPTLRKLGHPEQAAAPDLAVI